MNDCAVYRQDFTGNAFLVESGLTEARARELVIEYESHKHHQHYWADKMPSDKPDLLSLAREMLAQGSSAKLAIPVLATYQKSPTNIVAALAETSGLEVSVIETMVQEFFNTDVG